VKNGAETIAVESRIDISAGRKMFRAVALRA
jgi:hypothetical protein